MTAVVLPLDLDHSCGRGWPKTRMEMAYPRGKLPITPRGERACPACQYIRGYEDAQNNSVTR